MLFQFLPRLSDDEYAALEKSIREHGVQVPIVVDENRSVIDGHHRKEIADRLGVECPRRFAMDLTDEQKRTLALSLNLDRRHLSREQKRELVEKSLKADPHLSDRQHAERTGASPSTVGARRASMEDSGELSKLDSRTSADGRDRPASQPPRSGFYGPGERVEPGEPMGTQDAAPCDESDNGQHWARLHPDGTDEMCSHVAAVRAAKAPQSPEGEAAPSAAATDEVPSTPGSGVSNTPSPRPPVTGLDGKTYTRPEPRRAPRKPLTDSFFVAVHEVMRKAETLVRLTEDNRWTQNAEKVAANHRHDLLRISDLLEQVTASLPEKEPTP